MADQVSGVAGGVASKVGGATGTPLGAMTGALQGGLSNLFSAGMGFIDRWFPPQKREELKNKIMKFATEKPQLAAFLLSQIALSGIPLALFILMSITVLVFALVAGILVGVVGALLFTVFCVGLALIVLLPTLFMTTFAGTFIFLWGLAAYYIVKWFNEKDIPGIHTDAKDGMQKQLGLDSLPAINGQAALPQPQKPKKETHANGHHHADANGDKSSKQSSEPVSKKSEASSGQGTGADHGPVGDVKRTAGGVTSGVTSSVGL